VVDIVWYKLQHIMTALLLILVYLAVGAELGSVPPQPPLFIKDMEKQVHLQYGPINKFVLECVANAEPAPTYTWFKNGAPLPSQTAGLKLLSDAAGNGGGVAADGSVLEFTSPAPENEGYYHCLAENAHGRAKSIVVEVSHRPVAPPPDTRPPQFSEWPQVEILPMGEEATFSCVATGTPSPTIVWMKNSEVMVGETGPKLVLPNVGPADVANYACNASNVAGYVYKDAFLNILTVPADITDGPSNQIVSKGTNITMRCTTQGYPQPKVSWYLNDTRLIASSDKYRIEDLSERLTVLNAGPSDQGVYKCIAANHRQASKSGRLVVKSKTEIISGPGDQSVTVFSSVTLNCSVVSDLSEQLTVIWKKNNVDISERSEQDENHSLVLKNVTLDDKGTYTCVAFTASTSSHRATETGLLTVLGIPPTLAPMNSSYLLLEGEDLELVCNVTAGYESPEISWYKGGLPLNTQESSNAGDTITVQQSSLFISNAVKQNTDEYVCIAMNPWGSVNSSTRVQVRQRSRIVVEPEDVKFVDGEEAMLDCKVHTDAHMLESLTVQWYKNDQLIPVKPSESEVDVSRIESYSDYNDYDEANVNDDSQQEPQQSRYQVFQNHTLLITKMESADVGRYKCVASTKLDSPVISRESEIYLPNELPIWLLVLGLLIVCALLLLCCLLRMVRRRRKGKGYYGVKDIEISGGRHNKSDIYYTTEQEDGDSIMNEQDNLPLNTSTPATRTPIFTPKTVRHLANMNKSGGSVGSLSLLEDDEFLRRGMDEDGSFRERYTD